MDNELWSQTCEFEYRFQQLLRDLELFSYLVFYSMVKQGWLLAVPIMFTIGSKRVICKVSGKYSVSHYYLHYDYFHVVQFYSLVIAYIVFDPGPT